MASGALRRLGDNEVFSPAIPLDQLANELPLGLHPKMKYAHNYINILSETGSLTDAKWGVLQEIAREVPDLARKLNLVEEAQSASTQRMAGTALRQFAAVRSRGLGPSVIDRVREGTRELAIFDPDQREVDFTRIARPGSELGVQTALRRMSGSMATGGFQEIGDLNQPPGFGSVIYGSDAIGLVHPFEGALRGKSRISAEDLGRLPSSDSRRIADYMRRGLHVGGLERLLQMESLGRLHELAQGKNRADKADNFLEMFGNFVMPYLPESQVATPRSIYRGEVIPVEVLGKSGRGQWMDLEGGMNSRAASYSVEPYQAYRYSMMKKDGRLARALADSPSGEAVRRITQVRLAPEEQVAVLNPDLNLEGKSEVVYPTFAMSKRLAGEWQVYNAAEPEIPLIWQLYS